MTVDEIKEFHGFRYDNEVAEYYNVSKVAVSNWRETGIPTQRQALIQIQSQNKLKAELEETTS